MTISAVGSHGPHSNQPGARVSSPPPHAGTSTGPGGTPQSSQRAEETGAPLPLTPEERRFFEGLFPGKEAVIRGYAPAGRQSPGAEAVGHIVDRKG